MNAQQTRLSGLGAPIVAIITVLLGIASITGSAVSVLATAVALGGVGAITFLAQKGRREAEDEEISDRGKAVIAEDEYESVLRRAALLTIAVDVVFLAIVALAIAGASRLVDAVGVHGVEKGLAQVFVWVGGASSAILASAFVVRDLRVLWLRRRYEGDKDSPKRPSTGD